MSALLPYAGPGSTLVLLGASGAGKSTVVNAPAGETVMATGEVRDVDGKAPHHHPPRARRPAVGRRRHRHARPAGVALAGTEEGLAKAFADVEDLAAACRFADCSHTGEPGCAVQASIDAGDLSAERMDFWRRLQRELAWQARRTDARLQAEERAKWRAVTKARRGQVWRP